MNNDLIKRLRCGCVVDGDGILERATDKLLDDAADTIEAQAKRIAELEAEVKLLEGELRCAEEEDYRWEQDFALEQKRAEKGEADLAAARKALVWLMYVSANENVETWADYPDHAAAIAAARGEQEKIHD